MVLTHKNNPNLKNKLQFISSVHVGGTDQSEAPKLSAAFHSCRKQTHHQGEPEPIQL